jgi:hypothetical protein
LRIVSGFFLLNNDDSFNVFGLLKKYFGIRFVLSVTKFGHCNDKDSEMSAVALSSSASTTEQNV